MKAMDFAREGIPARRLVVELLNQTKLGRPASLETVAAHSRCSLAFARNTLEALGVDPTNVSVSLSTGTRLRLAMQVAVGGGLREAARFLNWREFETFAEQCLAEIGYNAQSNVRVKDGKRSWQIDIVALKADMALCIDCKHWTGPSYPSKFTDAAIHQVSATRSLIQRLRETRSVSPAGLPIILTLLEPRERVRNNVVLLSIEQLPDLLTNLTRYSTDLPFILPEDPRQKTLSEEAGF